MRSASHPILSFGDAATLHLANIQARVDLKPATKHYWKQVVAALLASWPDLAERKLTKVTEIDARDWAAAYQPQVSATRFNNTVDSLRAIFALGIKEGVMMWVHGDPLTGTKNWERRQVPIIPAMRRLLEDLRNNLVRFET